ncbi:MAG: phage terminase large subunit family protein [Proteobacteria bacterium]|nr:phage terminase large subunit family protein [Pseudomonadota bacterium]MBU1594248.1 phage terminase large subunit family protein [Pseudomonadota bacterium]
MRFRFTSPERHIFRRLPPQKPSDWAAEHLIVPDGPGAGGRWRRDVAPYAVGIMDTWAEPSVEEVLVCGTPQSGKTLIMYACLGYCVARRPGPRMLSMPDDPALAKVLEAKLKPLFRRTRPVARLLRKFRSGAILFRDGTALHLASAQSPSQRASISIQDLFMDEEDLYKQFAGAGVPVVDLMERTRQYRHKRKILRVSKPVGGEESSIWTAVHAADELRHFEVRCPACSEFQPMAEEGLVCLTESPSSKQTDTQRIKREGLGRYKCQCCGYLWTDHMRDVAVAAGRWRSTEPVARPRSVGFHLPAILSRAVSLSEILADKLAAEATDSPDVKQAYANGMWAEPYRPVVRETKESAILALRDPELPARTIPAGYVALTAGIDMQKHGFWFLVCAWTPGLECAVIDYGRLRDWEDVARLVWHTAYAQESGGPALPVWRAGLDTGGGKTDEDLLTRTEEAYAFIRRQPPNRVFATKGASRQMLTPVAWNVLDKMPRSRAPIPGGLTLYSLDPNYFKSLVHARLQADARQPLRLHRDCEESLAQQLAAERQVRSRSGQVSWERVHRDNHYLDCACLNFAAAHASWTPSLELLCQIEERRRQQAAAQPKPQAPAPQAMNPYTGEEHRS